MTRRTASLDAAYFEDIFRGNADPWNLESSHYERAKYERSVQALGGRHYRSAFEVGCARGVLTRQLAPSCDRLLAIDVSETALTAARARCRDLGHVAFEQMAFPVETPARAQFDLIIMSEVAYYWDDADLARASAWVDSHWAAGGDVLLVHWTGDTDYPQTGDDAVIKLRGGLTSQHTDVLAERTERYRLDLWRRDDQ